VHRWRPPHPGPGARTPPARTVYEWARLAFVSPVKALGSTVLLEGVMTCSSVDWLSYAALGYLIGVNAIAAGVTLALGARRPEETGS
jgi:hypothetical protein